MSSPQKNRKVIFHIIPRIEYGGTERIVTQIMLSEHLNAEWRHVLYVMKDHKGENTERLNAAGCEVRFLNINNGGVNTIMSIVKAILRLRRDCMNERPDLIMGWLYYGNILASLIAPKTVSVFHNIRNSGFDLSRYRVSVRLALRLNAIFSKKVTMTIYNSVAGRDEHQARGFSTSNCQVIYNGIDTELFKPSVSHRNKWRQHHHFTDDQKVVLMVGRNDPQKRYDQILVLAEKFPEIIFVSIGEGVEKLTGPKNFVPIAHQANIHTVYPGGDFILSTSNYGEGFQNTVAEGMASGLIPVCHDAGDIKILVGSTDNIAKNYTELADVLDHQLKLAPETFKQKQNQSREQISKNFSITQYNRAFLKLLSDIT